MLQPKGDASLWSPLPIGPTWCPVGNGLSRFPCQPCVAGLSILCHPRGTANNPGAASSLGEEAMSPAGADRGTQQPSRDAATFTRRLQTCISNTIAAHPRSSLKTSPAFSLLQTAAWAPSQLLRMERQKHLSDSEC